MTESESVALPLGDAAIYSSDKAYYTKMIPVCQDENISKIAGFVGYPLIQNKRGVVTSRAC
jgi:hypothetical protein